MELLFFGGRRRYPGETVPWGEYFGEWLEHPLLAAAALLCVIWMFVRFYGVWKSQREEREEQARQKERYGEPVEEKREELVAVVEEAKETAFSAEEQTQPRTGYEWRLFPPLFAVGFCLGMGGAGGQFISGSDFLLLLFAVVLIGGLFVAKNRPANWVYTSFEEDRKMKRRINWKAVAKGLIPYGLVLLAGLAFGLLQGWLIRR